MKAGRRTRVGRLAVRVCMAVLVALLAVPAADFGAARAAQTDYAAILYSDFKGRGRSQAYVPHTQGTIMRDIAGPEGLGGIPNDSTCSIWVSAGYKVTIYENDNYNPPSWSYTGPGLFNMTGENANCTSSYIVENLNGSSSGSSSSGGSSSGGSAASEPAPYEPPSSAGASGGTASDAYDDESYYTPVNTFGPRTMVYPAPTAVPTAKPTAVPTAKPTAVPTAIPTARPTAVPTAAPAVPTAYPTVKPTAIVVQTAVPSTGAGYDPSTPKPGYAGASVPTPGYEGKATPIPEATKPAAAYPGYAGTTTPTPIPATTKRSDTASPGYTATPIPAATKKSATATPKATEKGDATGKPTSSPKATEKADATGKPTSSPKATEKADATGKPTSSPKATATKGSGATRSATATSKSSPRPSVRVTITTYPEAPGEGGATAKPTQSGTSRATATPGPRRIPLTSPPSDKPMVAMPGQISGDGSDDGGSGGSGAVAEAFRTEVVLDTVNDNVYDAASGMERGDRLTYRVRVTNVGDTAAKPERVMVTADARLSLDEDAVAGWIQTSGTLSRPYAGNEISSGEYVEYSLNLVLNERVPQGERIAVGEASAAGGADGNASGIVGRGGAAGEGQAPRSAANSDGSQGNPGTGEEAAGQRPRVNTVLLVILFTMLLCGVGLTLSTLLWQRVWVRSAAGR